MPSYRVGHIHLNSPEPFKTAEFYEKYFNAKRIGIVDRGELGVIVKLELSGMKILISPFANQPAGLVHFGLITDTLEQAIHELKSEGVKFTQDITRVPEGFHISFLSAPENVRIELQDGE